MKAIGIIVGILLGGIVYVVLCSGVIFTNNDRVFTTFEAIILGLNSMVAAVVSYYVMLKFINWYLKHLY